MAELLRKVLAALFLQAKAALFLEALAEMPEPLVLDLNLEGWSDLADGEGGSGGACRRRR